MSVLAQLRLPPIAADVLHGLRRTPKSLPPYLFYDAAGSALFEQITHLAEYYLTRTELLILRDSADAIAASLPAIRSVVELGAGSAPKTGVLLQALRSRTPELTYIPVDISPTALQGAADRMLKTLANFRVRPSVRDYTSQPLPSARSPRLVLYLGSSIGNFDPPDAARLLRRIAGQLGPGGALLLGTDLRKSSSILLPAYDDAQGVTARFNLNLLARLNRELGADFDSSSFRHVAIWNNEESRMEMHLESRRDQLVRFRQLDAIVRFRRGERLHTENSYKYSEPMLADLFAAAGLQCARTWTDPQHWFAVHLLRAA